MIAPSPIPAPRPDDDEDVHWALSTASALWARGDAIESIKWLRRAAETASDQNRDQRALELFKAAADATSLVGRPPAPTAPLPNPPPPARATNPPPNAPGRPPTGPMGTLSMQIPPGAAQSPAPPPVRPSSAPMPPPQPSPAPAPARAPLPQRSPAPPGGGPGGPPAGTARAAAAHANAQTQVVRAGAVGFSSQRPAAPIPGAGVPARGVLKQTLPSEGAPPILSVPSAPIPVARPSPGTGAGAAPSSAAKRAESRKRPLDERFHFPDEEVTIQRDLAALKKPRPVHTDLAAAAAEEAAAAAATQRAPVVAQPPVARTLISTTAGATVRGLQAMSRAPSPQRLAAPGHAIANEQTTAEPTDHEHTPIDDLDEQTSVLAGDEPELDFEGSATGETSAALLASIEQNQLEQGNLDEGVTGEESSDPRHGGLAAPSVRPDPLPRAPSAAAQGDATAWTAVRVAVRRDATGVRVETLARGARPPRGSVAAVLVAQDDASAEALLSLLEG